MGSGPACRRQTTAASLARWFTAQSFSQHALPEQTHWAAWVGREAAPVPARAQRTPPHAAKPYHRHRPKRRTAPPPLLQNTPAEINDSVHPYAFVWFVWSLEVFTILFALVALVVDFNRLQAPLLALVSIVTVLVIDLINA